MWMESLEQRQLWAPIAGDFSALPVIDGLVVAHRATVGTENQAVWIADHPRDLAVSRRDEETTGTSDGVVVMAL